jgi:hypothetical protein
MRRWREGYIEVRLTLLERQAVMRAREAGWPLGGGLAED